MVYKLVNSAIFSCCSLKISEFKIHLKMPDMYRPPQKLDQKFNDWEVVPHLRWIYFI